MMKTLFNDGELRTYLEGAHRDLSDEIEALTADQILSPEQDELVRYLTEKYSITVPTIDDQRITLDSQEVRIDISRDPMRLAHLLNPNKPSYADGTRITYHVPYTGNADLFTRRPSTYSNRFPEAAIDEQELRYSFEFTEHDSARVKADFEDALGQTKLLLSRIANDVQPYNEQTQTAIKERLEARRTKLKKDAQLTSNLGYPLRPRPDAPNTYRLPITRKNIPALARPRDVTPEPAIDLVAYDHILGIMQNMVLVMERSPRAFQTMTEEHLRTHFLVQLNGHYEGDATGETFNSQGKTDILIRRENKNLFIAECKFWDGPKSLSDAIDQLLGYTSWRDTKTAILLFNRNKNFTNVVQQIPGVVQAHPNFVQQHPYANETGYRFTMRQTDDPQRSFTMTVLAFNIPT